jgi:uncharacterized protein (DUF58 family)
LFLLALFQFFILKSSFKKNVPDFPLPFSVNGGESFSVHLELFLPILLPGFRSLWRTELYWNEGKRTVSAVQSLKRGSRLYEVPFLKLLRGVYRGKSGIIVLEDLFGFTRFVLFQGENLSLQVFPDFIKNGISKDKIIAGGQVATADIKRIRSEELLEVRKYYPGDDARRINWKMFATSGELFMRIGEEIPPPTGEITLILNSQSLLIHSFHNASLYTDLLICAFLTFVYAFVEKGYLVYTLVPGKREALLFDIEKPDNLLAALSAVTAKMPLLQFPDSSFIYIVTHPGSDSLKESVRTNRGEMKIFIKDLPDSKEKITIKRFLFKNEKNSELSFFDLRHLADSGGIAEKDIKFLKKIGKGKVHGEII